jgi:hypothetical protein
MLEHGDWRPTAEGDGRTAGFHLSSLYSPLGWSGMDRSSNRRAIKASA